MEMLVTMTLGLGMIAWSIWAFRKDLADFREKGQGWGFLHLITGIPFTLGGFLLGIIIILLSIWG